MPESSVTRGRVRDFDVLPSLGAVRVDFERAVEGMPLLGVNDQTRFSKHRVDRAMGL
jgi:hypothetical protein